MRRAAYIVHAGLFAQSKAPTGVIKTTTIDTAHLRSKASRDADARAPQSRQTP
jgi:hypothetical protein